MFDNKFILKSINQIKFYTTKSITFYLQTNQVQDDLKEEEPVDMKPKLSSKKIYANLKKRMESIKKSCGQVCQTDMKGEPGKYYQAIRKDVDCKSLFTNTDIDEASEFQFPPTKIPKYL